MSVYLVTGANRGIGLEMCRQLKARGETVIAVCRHSSSELDELGVELIDSVDVRDPSDLKALKSTLDGRQIDVLMNVAGVLRKQSLGEIDDTALDQIRLQFETNAIAPLLVTQALMDLIPESGKVGIVTSRMGSRNLRSIPERPQLTLRAADPRRSAKHSSRCATGKRCNTGAAALSVNP